MSVFQAVALALIATMLAVSARKLSGVQARASAALFWFVLWSAAALAILNPDATTVVARRLGIQRGADLVVYCAILAFFAAFFFVYVRIRQLTRDVTLLTRELAVRAAQDPVHFADQHEPGPVAGSASAAERIAVQGP
jgi:hypothetical protein